MKTTEKLTGNDGLVAGAGDVQEIADVGGGHVKVDGARGVGEGVRLDLRRRSAGRRRELRDLRGQHVGHEEAAGDVGLRAPASLYIRKPQSASTLCKDN